MTITHSLVAPAAINNDLQLVSLPDLTDFSVVAGDDTFATAKLQSGDNQAPITFGASKRYNSRNDTTYVNMYLEAHLKSVSDVSDEVVYQPVRTRLAWEFPGRHVMNSLFTTQQISMLFAIFAQELTGTNGTPTTKVVDMVEAGQFRDIVG